MVGLSRIKKDMAQMLEIDRSIHSVEVRADTLEEALDDASVQFDTKVSNLEYEIISKGFKGIGGLAKKPWTIRVYPNQETVAKQYKAAMAASGVGGEAGEEAEQIVVKDGVFFIHRFDTNIVLKVVLPENGGAAVNADEIVGDLRRPDTLNFDEKKVRKLAASGTGDKYEVIGEYKHVPSADALVVIDLAKDKMSATATITPPQMGGADISVEQCIKAAETQGVLAGISEEKIQALVDSPIYNAPVVVVEAPKPIDGKDAYMVYNFETDRSKIKFQENDQGQVDFKERNIIQNVQEGDVLAYKVPAEKGKAGKTIFSEYLEASDGKDIQIPAGKNTKIAEDGVSIVATVSGQVLLENGRVSVEPVMELSGVNLKNGGNIDFLGTVIVKGNVEDGFSVKASGNIEVTGNVGACQLTSDANIVVNAGIIGRDAAKIYCKGSLWAKFIENSEITVDENIIVQEAILNSRVSAQKKIVLTGKKAQIAGGDLSATEMILAKNIGSGGTETLLSVGMDPKLKKRLEELQEMQSKDVKEMEDVELDINSLEQQQKMRKSLPKEKEAQLAELTKRRDELIEHNYAYNEEIGQIQGRMKELRNTGRVYASGNVYAGVKINIREENKEIRTDAKNIMYFYDTENRIIKSEKFQQPNLDDLKGPDGYSAN